MRKFAVLLLALALFLTACGGGDDDEQSTDQTPEQAPTQFVIVVTATPIPDENGDQTGPAPTQIVVVVTATPDPNANTAPATDITSNTPGSQTAEAPMATDQPPTPRPVSATPIPEIFPTNTYAQVQVAEQVFERGRMFWLRHNRQIWVMLANSDDPNIGDWLCYNDTFEEGEMEVDPDLIPPEGLYQPRRGFGKLWRNHQEIKDGLGWGITPEFELTSNYTYIAGGYVEGEEYFPGPGEHRLTTLYNESLSFFERDIRGDCQGGTWRIATGQ